MDTTRRIPFEQLRDRVIQWVTAQEEDIARFRMNEEADSSIFTTCFALFIFDLFRMVDSWGKHERVKWVDYVRSYQDEETGLFVPTGYNGAYDAKIVHQCTAFCLSALSILNASPTYPLSCCNSWTSADELERYLRENGCFEGRSESGNKAMFCAIFLTYEFERTGQDHYRDRIEDWFKLHDEHQNTHTGFWGSKLMNTRYFGFQNALHQFVVYNYHNRTIGHNEKIVDIVLGLQDNRGHCAPMIGGGSCWDYDAVDILIQCGLKHNYRSQEIRRALTTLAHSILAAENDDGGFCETRNRPSSLFALMSPRTLRFVLGGGDLRLWQMRFKHMCINSRRSRAVIKTQWTNRARAWSQSNLWDTWFRCLALAEIDAVLNNGHDRWKFHSSIGLGWFKFKKALTTESAEGTEKK